MASAKTRRISKARKFLQSEEVHLILNEENSLKNLVSSFQIDEELKKKISKDPNSVKALKLLEEFYSKGVCQIIVTSPDSNYSHCGSGFYIGDGWILTSSNVVRNRNQVNHASFTFTSNDGTFTFDARERRAFVYRTLLPGRRPDYHNRDVTLIKLGVQYSFRQDVALWERDEQALLTSQTPFSYQNLCKQGFLPPSSISIQTDDVLCTVYYGKDTARFHVGFQASQPRKVLEPVGVTVYEFSGGFSAEASGCPVFVFRNGQCYLLGLFLPGRSSKPTGCKVFSYNGQALVWDEEFLSHISAGIKAVDKMSNIVSYSLAIPFDERKKLLNERTVYQAAELALNHRVLIL